MTSIILLLVTEMLYNKEKKHLSRQNNNKSNKSRTTPG